MFYGWLYRKQAWFSALNLDLDHPLSDSLCKGACSRSSLILSCLVGERQGCTLCVFGWHCSGMTCRWLDWCTVLEHWHGRGGEWLEHGLVRVSPVVPELWCIPWAPSFVRNSHEVETAEDMWEIFSRNSCFSSHLWFHHTNDQELGHSLTPFSHVFTKMPVNCHARPPKNSVGW